LFDVFDGLMLGRHTCLEEGMERHSYREDDSSPSPLYNINAIEFGHRDWIPWHRFVQNTNLKPPISNFKLYYFFRIKICKNWIL